MDANDGGTGKPRSLFEEHVNALLIAAFLMRSRVAEAPMEREGVIEPGQDGIFMGSPW